MMFTRTLTTYEANAFTIDVQDGEAITKSLGHCSYIGTHASIAEARKALKAAGIEIPRGAKIIVKELESATYGCSVEEFMTVAKVIERS